MKIFGIILGSIGTLIGLAGIVASVLEIAPFELVWYGVISMLLGVIMVILFPKWAKE